MSRLLKFIRNMLLFFLVAFSSSALAKKVADDQCKVQGNKDFYVVFKVTGLDGKYQDMYFSQGSTRRETLWYTPPLPDGAPNPKDGAYIFEEASLDNNVDYVVRIEHDEDTHTSYYYRRLASDADFQFITSKVEEIKPGNLTGSGIEIEITDCSEDNVVVLPPPIPEIPDQCETFPNAAQSWNRDGQPYSSATIDNNGQIIGTYNQAGRIGFNQVTTGQGVYLCDGNECLADDTLLISEPALIGFSPYGLDLTNPTDPLPSGSYSSITINNNNEATFTGTDYEIGTLVVEGSSTLNIRADTFLRVNRVVFSNQATINVLASSGSESLVIWAENLAQSPAYVEIGQLSVPLEANIFSRGSVLLNGWGAFIYGSVTADTLTVQGSAKIQRTSNNCEGTTPGNYTLELSPLTGINLTCEDQSLTFQVKKNGSNATDYPGTIEVTSSGGLLQPSGGSYTPSGSGTLDLTLSQQEVSTVSVTGCLSTDCSGTSVNGSYEFVPQKFALESPKGVVAAKPSSIDIWPMQCNEQGEPAAIPSDEYSGTKTLMLSSTTYVQPNADRNASEVISIKDKDGNWVDAPNNQLQLTFSAGSDSEPAKATTEVIYPEAGSVSYELKDEVCITNDDGEEECEEIIGEQLIQSRPWTFALCEPTGNEISGTSESGDFFKRSGELFGLDAVPIRWVSDGDIAPATPIEVSAFCNQIDSLETKNFYPDLAPAVNVSLEAELHSPHVDLGSADTGTIGSGLEGVPVDGLPNNTNTSGPVQFSSLKWREAGSIKVTASLKDQADYLFEPINPGYRSVGRFSPNHLAMLDEGSDPEELWTQWDYADGHDEFAYMKQEFPHIFKVQAQANDNTPTLNYGLFNNSFVSNLDYVANTKDQTVDVSLLDRLSVLTFSWSGEDWPKSLLIDPSTLVVTIDDFAFAKKAGDSIGDNEVTEPDGPFDSDNSVFGIEVSTIVDGVDFDTLDIPELNEDTNTGKSFPNQPEFRYGRMNLDDVGGNTAQTLRVPLRVEYWDGSSFVTNQEDSGSLFDATQSYCVQTIWNNLPNGADTSAELVSNRERQVSDGASDKLSATHNPAAGSSNERAQVRLWLRQGSDSPQRTETGVDCTSNGSRFTNQPWLHYNWRNKGDEDPSAVVTFGTFRGNDRIIFKGERGLIGN
ncbi:DUF6701 domain-containing protein [Vibrio breoganii]|uniref:DUF6701 domain-containing protein n=1 Tax=Vibrio breoganii TaxID=553239 RepID=UPI000C837319|nr:DUF6701 domain-containing protein [Vibrio breoganii]PMO33520.1 hypothetical protein BCT12_15380 [Vibrio breoganii]